MVGIKYATQVVPFPTEKGFWIRLVFKGNTIEQGNVMLFDFEKDVVILMEQGGDSKPEVVRQGDEMSINAGYLVTYTRIEGVTFFKRQQPAGQEKSDKPPSPS